MIYIFLSLHLYSWSVPFPKYSSIIFFLQTTLFLQALTWVPLFLPSLPQLRCPLMNSSFESHRFHCSSYLPPLKGAAWYLVTPCSNPWLESVGPEAGEWGWGSHLTQAQRITGWPVDSFFLSFWLSLASFSLSLSFSQLNYQLKKQSTYTRYFG